MSGPYLLRIILLDNMKHGLYVWSDLYTTGILLHTGYEKHRVGRAKFLLADPW